jgi:hypothetical protein
MITLEEPSLRQFVRCRCGEPSAQIARDYELNASSLNTEGVAHNAKKTVDDGLVGPPFAPGSTGTATMVHSKSGPRGCPASMEQYKFR